MNGINWKQKLTSRKFAVSVIGFITTLLVAFKVNDITIEQVTAIISASLVLIAYILGESLVDSARIDSDSKLKDEENDLINK